MKQLVFLFFLSSIFSSCTTTIFLVRHAEKADNSRNPDLSAEGYKRADQLAILLKNEHIINIFSTDYKRTLETSIPLNKITHSSIQMYSADTLNNFAARIKKQKVNTLIVGHSNTTINLLDALGVPHKVKVIPDSDYSNLFKITKKSSGKMKLEELKY
jgi:phosphohistidine phosphatase SixA